jgi:hypothetical protein
VTHVATVVVPPQAETLTDFPLYVDLSTLNSTFWSTVANGGGDIRCYAADGTTALPREVVSCDTASDTGELHVKVTLSASDFTFVQIHADGSSSEPAFTDPTHGRNAVWADYAMVFHGDDSADSTGHHTFSQVAAPTYVSGQLGNAVAGGKWTAPTTSALDSALSGNVTVQLWWKFVGATQNEELVDQRTDTSGSWWSFWIQSDYIAFNLDDGAANKGVADTTFDFDTDGVSNQWYLLTGVRNVSTPLTAIYKDGALLASVADASGDASSTKDLSIDPTYGDEIRIRGSALSANWIATEYKNQSDPASFYWAAGPNAAHTATVTVDQTIPAVRCDDFPMYIDLADMPASFWSSVANGGGDIRTFLADGTELAREVVSCEPGIPAGIGPSVVGVATSTGADSGSPEYSFDINLPSGIASGDVLLLIGINGSGTDTFSAISGFDVLEYESNSFTQLFIAARVADGTEGASVSASWTASVGNVAFLAYCIRGTSLDNLEFLLSSRRGTSTPLFPTFTHSKDDNNLFIAAGFFDDDNSSVVSASSGWDNFQIASSGTVTNSSVRVAAVQLEQEGDSVSPGGWQLSELEGFWPLIIGFAPKRDQGELHVKVPTLSIIQDTVLHIYTDGASADYAATDPFGRNAVWGDYGAVYHFSDGASATSVADSSGNVDLAVTGTVSEVDSGGLGTALDFGGSAYATADTAAISNFPLTMSAWFRYDEDGFISDVTDSGAPFNRVFMHTTGGKVRLYADGDTNVSSASTLTAGNWYLAHGVAPVGSAEAMYINGSQDMGYSGLTSTRSIAGLDRTDVARLGDSTPGGFGTGPLGELRIRPSDLSAQWIATEYNNQSDPSSFYTATDPNAGGGVSVAVPAASVTITGYAPTVTGEASISVDVPVGEISVTGYAPTVTSTDNIEVAIPADSLTVTGYAPTVTSSDSQEVSPGADSIAVTGYAPTIAITDAQAIVIPAGSVTVTGYAPSVETTSNVTVEVDTGSVSITGHAPAVGTSISVSPAVSTLSITGYAPAVVASVKTVTCTLVDVNGRALPNLSDLSYAWFDEPDPANLSTPVVKGVTESTDGSGVIEVPISGSSLTSGQTGLLVLRSSDGESLGAYNLPVA